MEKQHIFYRVESNFGCKYFESATAAKNCFFRKVDNDEDVEIWRVVYTFNGKMEFLHGEQKLMGYSGCNFLKV